MIGIDIVFIPRFSSLIKNRDRKSLERSIFTSSELDQLTELNETARIRSLAGRFAAKEAVIKASMGELKITDLKRIEVIQSAEGYLEARVKSESAKVRRYMVSISHDGEYAVGMALEGSVLHKNHFSGENLCGL